MNKANSITPIMVSLGLYFTGAGSGCSQPTAADTVQNSGDTAGNLDRVTVGTPQRKTLTLYTTQPGQIDAFEQTALVPKISGYVQEVAVDIGDQVQKGQVLLKLWVPELQDELVQKQALVAQADAEVSQAAAMVQAAEAAVDTAAAQVDQSEAGIGRTQGDLERWKAEHERMMQLAADGSVAQKLVDETRNQFRSTEAAQQEALANVRSAGAALNEARANVRKAQADHGAAEARYRVAQANLARAATMLNYADIKAPFAGVITSRNVDTGHYVQPQNGSSNKPLLVVVRTDKVRIFVDVPEMESTLVDSAHQPDAAVVHVQSLGREFEAAVTRTGWALDASNRSLRTEIDIANPEGVLRPGMYATATILLEQRNDALVLPISAIIRDGRDAYCCVVTDGKVDRRSLKLGLRSGAEVEILGGVDEQDQVVLARSESLKQGQPVEVMTPVE